MPAARLITIPFSHYCEKARWALDRTGVAYREDAYLPGMHRAATREVSGRTVPVLVTAERTFTDSTEIVRHADALAAPGKKLYPADAGARREVEEIEAACNDRLGVAARLYVYHHALPLPASLVRLVRPSLTRVQAAVMPIALRFVRGRIRGLYKVNTDSAAKAIETTRAVFDDVGKRLGSRRWLVGDGFTAADLTFASLAAIVLLPHGHPSLAPIAEELPEPVRSAVRELRATPAGKHALRMYAEERTAH